MLQAPCELELPKPQCRAPCLVDALIRLAIVNAGDKRKQKTEREIDKGLVTFIFTTLPSGDGKIAASTLLILEGVWRWPLIFLAEEKQTSQFKKIKKERGLAVSILRIVL